ncbi:glutamate 5-kinase [Blastococcus sp. Marseille-P5729]|uniref:glutamate 5-kinase n=1 Tax=Blastococcus sp. Marseille-P5729 TaxID=2086582 RepID=UPI000D0E380B|nr:glutamate 5-kinase [Blastococcus sp. Marseille-P5729]
MTSPHAVLGDAKRVVVKVGSSSLTKPAQNGGTGLDADRIGFVADVIAEAVQDGREVVLVSSGAIAAGLEPLRLRRRPRDLATQQAAASVGQLLLAEAYATAFARHGLQVGQVLLTSDDLQRRTHYRNAQRSLERLLRLGVVPIVNENDVVVTDEIRFGDNDRLAALTAHLVSAQGMVLLSDVDGVYDANPAKGPANLIPVIEDEAGLRSVDTSGPVTGGVGTGGMTTKLDSARIASGAGVAVIITSIENAREAVAGQSVGTFVPSRGKRPSQRLFWLRWASEPRGQIVLDEGAVRAVAGRRKSLLPAGITGSVGNFEVGDAVELVGPDGLAIARGLVAYSSEELPDLIGKQTHDLDADHQREVMHRDDIAVL